MLYTFSQADYPRAELEGYFHHMTEKDAVVLWQDGVLLAVKYPELFAHCQGKCVALEQDISARNLTALFSQTSKVRLISLTDLVDITTRFSPQMAL